MVLFFIGLFIGVFVGIIILGLLSCSKLDDIEQENFDLKCENYNLKKELGKL